MSEQQHGLDVSHHQGRIDWKKVAASGRTFAYCKVTESTDYLDPTWARNAAGAKAAGLLVGGYHFAHPGRDAHAQARHFVQHLAQQQHGMLPPVLDLERSDNLGQTSLAGWSTEFLSEVHKLTGRLPLLYSSPAFVTERLGAHAGRASLSSYPLWLAQYNREAHVPAPWPRYTLWQYTNAGKVPGAGVVDLDVFDGTLAQLRELAGYPHPPAPAPARKVPPPCRCP